MKAVFRGRVKGRRFVANDVDRFVKAFDLPDDTEVDVSVEKAKRKRSNPQNRWLWGCIYAMVGAKIGEDDAEEVHAMMKVKFNYETKVVSVVQMNKKTGKTRTIKRRVKVPRSTASLSTEEFSEYCERIRRWAAEFLGLYIPDPDEVDV